MENVKRFKLTEKHIKLLRSAYVDFNDSCEYGAPEIDPKRPYGNSYVEGDIHEILGGKPGAELSESKKNKYRELHMETTTALQIVLATGKFAAGTYELSGFGKNWVKVA